MLAKIPGVTKHRTGCTGMTKYITDCTGLSGLTGAIVDSTGR